MPMDDEYEEPIYLDILKNTTFSYSKDASQLISFFLGMHSSYQPKPEVIVVDFLHTFFDTHLLDMDTDANQQMNFIECHMLITAALHGAVDMFCRRNSNANFMSFICIDPQSHDVYKHFIQRYVDIYYYKENAILSFDNLNEKLRD